MPVYLKRRGLVHSDLIDKPLHHTLRTLLVRMDSARRAFKPCRKLKVGNPVRLQTSVPNLANSAPILSALVSSFFAE